MATNTTIGAVKLNSSGDYGIYINTSTSQLITSPANEEIINTRNSSYRPITPNKLNYAVKAALTDTNHLTMTSAEQATAQSVLGISGGGGDTSALSSAIDAISGILSGYTDQKLIFTLQDNSTITATFFVKDIISGAAPENPPSSLYVTIADSQSYPPADACSGTYLYVSGHISDNTALYQQGNSSTYCIIYNSSNSRWEIADIPEVSPSSLYFYGSALTGTYTGFQSYYGTATVALSGGGGGGGGGGSEFHVTDAYYASAEGTYLPYDTSGYGGSQTYKSTDASWYIFKIQDDDSLIWWAIGSAIETTTAGPIGQDYHMYSLDNDYSEPPTSNWTGCTVTKA